MPEFVSIYWLIIIGEAGRGGGEQVIVASHPIPFTLPSEVNTKVKLPEMSVDVNGPGIVVPVNVPKDVPAVPTPS